MLREVVGRPLPTITLQRKGGDRVRARGSSDREVDPIGKKSAQHAERLGDFERAVVGQHHTTTAHTEPRGGGCDRTDEDLRARPR